MWRCPDRAPEGLGLAIEETSEELEEIRQKALAEIKKGKPGAGFQWRYSQCHCPDEVHAGCGRRPGWDD